MTEKPLDDRIEEFCFQIVCWPLECAQGRHWALRLTALTLGWVWMLPALIAFGVFVLIPILLPLTMWAELKEPR